MTICKAPAPARYNAGCDLTSKVFGHTTGDTIAFGFYGAYPEKLWFNEGCVRQPVDCDMSKWSDWDYCLRYVRYLRRNIGFFILIPLVVIHVISKTVQDILKCNLLPILQENLVVLSLKEEVVEILLILETVDQPLPLLKDQPKSQQELLLHLQMLQPHPLQPQQQHQHPQQLLQL
jgi:hypothetical protein